MIRVSIDCVNVDEALQLFAKLRAPASPPVAGPAPASPPVAGPAPASPPVAGPAPASPPVAGPAPASPPVAGPAPASPPVAGPAPASPPVAGPAPASPPVAGPAPASPPVAGPAPSVTGLPVAGTPDSKGTPFDPELHSGTTTAAGAWRKRRGATPKAEAYASVAPVPNGLMFHELAGLCAAVNNRGLGSIVSLALQGQPIESVIGDFNHIQEAGTNVVRGLVQAEQWPLAVEQLGEERATALYHGRG